MDCTPHWTTYLSALLVPTVAILGAVIAYRQWKTAQNKLKLELFEMRFAIYESARNLLAAILTTGKAKDEELFKYLTATREAKWLLSSEVAQYLDKDLYHKVVELQTLQAELVGVPVGEVRTKNVHKQAEIKKWLMSQHKVLDEKFSPFLVLRH